MVDAVPTPSPATGGLKSGNFRRIAWNGFGDPQNSHPHSMAWFRDYLYVGTSRNVLAVTKTIFDLKKCNLKNLAVWPVKVPENMYSVDMRSQIWRYNPLTDEWSKVFTSPMVKGIGGFDVPLSVGLRAMATFQGKDDPSLALYVATSGGHQRPEAVLLRSLDGENFEVIPFSNLRSNHPIPKSLRILVAFKGHLFTAGVGGGKIRGQPNIADAMEILVTSNPAKGEWHLACEPCFGDPNNLTVFSMATFNDFLYAGTLNVAEGYQIWKTDAEGSPPYHWTKVLSQGAYRGKLNQMAMTLAPFGEYLYVGSAIQNGGRDYDNNVGPAGPELIRVASDDSWELVAGEPRSTPNGVKIPLSGLGPGFNNCYAGYIWQLCAHAGWFYLGLAGTGMFLWYVNWEALANHRQRIVNPLAIDDFIRRFGGFHLWRSRDGIRWLPVTLNGFGNPYNMGPRTMVSTPFGLFIGAANPFGPEVVRKRTAGWTYESNQAGGLEIWLGSTAQPQRKSAILERTASSRGDKNYPGTGKNNLSREELLAQYINEFYAGSDFRHFGFWESDTKDAKTACENLMAETLAFIPENQGTILDLGCGLGATTRHLVKHFGAEAVTGVTTQKKDIKICQHRVPGTKFFNMKPTRLRFKSECFDYVVCLEGLGNLGDRKKLLQQIYRILKPGGRLVFADIIYHWEKKTRFPFWGRVTSLRNIEAYQYLLQGVGFESQVIDVSSQSLVGFCRYLNRYLETKLLLKEINHETANLINTILFKDCDGNCCYVMGAAIKPVNANH